MTIEDIINLVKKNNITLGNVLETFIKHECKDIAFSIIPIEMFRHTLSGYSVKDTIVINEDAISEVMSTHTIYVLMYIIFHEVGHNKRNYNISNIDFDSTDLNLFISIAQKEENAADEYAHDNFKKLAHEFDLPELIERTLNFKSPSGYELYSSIYMKIMENRKTYNNDINRLVTDLAHNRMGTEIAEPEIKPAPTQPKKEPKPNPLKIPSKVPDNIPMPIPKAVN